MSVAFIVILTLVFFGLQLALCVKARRRVVKGIPLYLIVLSFLLALACAAGLFGTSSMGALAAHELAGLFLAMFTAFALLGAVLGWCAYGIVLLVRKKKTA